MDSEQCQAQSRGTTMMFHCCFCCFTKDLTLFVSFNIFQNRWYCAAFPGETTGSGQFSYLAKVTQLSKQQSQIRTHVFDLVLIAHPQHQGGGRAEKLLNLIITMAFGLWQGTHFVLLSISQCHHPKEDDSNCQLWGIQHALFYQRQFSPMWKATVVHGRSSTKLLKFT